MIVNKVSYGGENLVTIYHDGVEDEDESYERKVIKQKINQFNLCFEQFKVSEEALNNIPSSLFKQEGLLSPKDELNIYSGNICAKYRRYVSTNKPKKVIKTVEDKLDFKLPIEVVITINEFIKKYTGLDLNKNTFFYGDTFVFEPVEIDIFKNESNGLTIRNIEMQSEVVIRFKNNRLIVATYKRLFEKDFEEIEINPKVEWKSFDIEFYKNNELFFLNSDFSFIDSIQLNMEIINSTKNVKLNSLSSNIDIPTKSTEFESVIGKENSLIEELDRKSKIFLARKIRNELEMNDIIFIKPGETEKSLKEITKFLNKNLEEVWVFDPYLTDRSRFSKTLDWLRIFSELPIKQMNFVFYCKGEEKAYSCNSLESVLQNNEVKKKTKAWFFIETKSAIHDRFILSKTNEGHFSGLTIGTSLNSVDTNHFCISQLNHNSTKTILNELIEFLEDDNMNGLIKI